jgi:hypothetical protein
MPVICFTVSLIAGLERKLLLLTIDKVANWCSRYHFVRFGLARCYIDNNLLQHNNLHTTGFYQYRRL